jgi:MFS family permease
VRVRTSQVIVSEEVAVYEQPRDDIVAETVLGNGEYGLAEGPFTSYERRLSVEPAGTGLVEVTEVTEFTLSVPVWKVILNPIVKRELKRRRPPGNTPWWAPSDRMDARSASVLGMLALLALFAGFLGSLLSQTITFVADDFGADKSAQGLTLAAVRIGVLLSLALVALADKRGRKRILIGAAIAGCLVAATAALTTSLWGFGFSQTIARGLSTAMALLIGIAAAEETPAGSRAYAASILALCAALGSGMVVWLLPIADLGISAWRIIYLVPLLALPAVFMIGKRLPETKRFEAYQERNMSTPTDVSRRRRRIGLLGTSAFLTAMFVAPASQFQNEFLRTERGYSGVKISLFQLTTNTPAGIGIFVGGHLADVRGRRLVGAVALIGGTLLTVVRFAGMGWVMWVAGILGTMIGAAIIPTLGVYGPEMFGTGDRGWSNGILTTIGVMGSALGLILVGVLTESVTSFGATFAFLAIAPLTVAVLVLTLYPETARRELEDINPEDRAETGEPDG